ncbi:MAG TPA: macro domain-containing protein [Candidatus Binatus sp.]|nr:macro domain-containing protein [Candidatus Binatus sp.]
MTMNKDWRAKVVLRQGDLTEADVDAIVNAANNDLMLGGGVAGAIRVKGGPSIQRECDSIGQIRLGEAAITGAGLLRARHVIHAASMRLGESTSEGNLRASTRNSLKRANENSLKTIAFPAIGTGIAGFPIERCAQVMLEEVRAHLGGATTLERVEFVLFDERTLKAFERILNQMND